jgi:DNA-binding response OmpR family regulator
VDDNQNITKLLERFLKLKEHNGTIANNVKEALSLVDKNNFDAIVLDLAMPELTGIDFLNALRENGNVDKNKIVILTASNVTNEDESNLLQMGASAILRKPVKLDVLMETILK